MQENIASFLTTTLELRRNPEEHLDLIHAFGPYSLAVAMFFGGNILYTPGEFPRKHMMRWMRAAIGYRNLHVACPTDTMRRWLVRNGVPIERVHLIRPGVDFGKIKTNRDDEHRRELRKTLGFSPDDYVVLPGGETTHRALHLYAVQATTILHWLKPEYKSLLWGRGPLTEPRSQFGKKLDLKGFLQVAQRRMGRPMAFEELLPAVDLVLFVAHSPVPTLPIALTMAAGVPIIAAAQSQTTELLEDRHNALLTLTAHPRLVAKRILELRDDPQQQWKLTDTARTEAYEYFSQSRLIQQYRSVYAQIAEGKKVEVPQTQPGAGSRFHGRA